jgi:hypothetical protein
MGMPLATLEQVERQVIQLPLREQIKLIAHISERLGALPLAMSSAEGEEEARAERLAQAEAWIARCDQVAELWKGEFDSAADLRRIRDEE